MKITKTLIEISKKLDIIIKILLATENTKMLMRQQHDEYEKNKDS